VGCVPIRTVHGQQQSVVESASRRALTWSNTPREKVVPLIPTMPGEAEVFREHVRLSPWGWPIGRVA